MFIENHYITLFYTRSIIQSPSYYLLTLIAQFPHLSFAQIPVELLALLFQSLRPVPFPSLQRDIYSRVNPPHCAVQRSLCPLVELLRLDRVPAGKQTTKDLQDTALEVHLHSPRVLFIAFA